MTMDTIFGALAQAGAAREDLVYTKTYVTDLGRLDDYTRAGRGAGRRPPGFHAAGHSGAAAARDAHRDRGRGHHRRRENAPRHLHRAHAREAAWLRPRVAVSDVVHVSGCTSMSSKGELQAVGDWRHPTTR